MKVLCMNRRSGCLSEVYMLGVHLPAFRLHTLVALSLYHSLFGNHINFIFRSWVPWASLSAVLIERHITGVAITWAGTFQENQYLMASQIRIIIMIIIIVVYSDAGKIRRRTYDIRCLSARYLVESKLRISRSITVLFTVIIVAPLFAL